MYSVLIAYEKVNYMTIIALKMGGKLGIKTLIQHVRWYIVGKQTQIILNELQCNYWDPGWH